MDRRSDTNPKRARIVLDGLDEGRAGPRLALHAFGDGDKLLGSVPVESDGTFPVDAALLEKAARVMVGPADADPAARRGFYTLPGDELRRLVRAEGELAIAGGVWRPWLPVRRCVSGRVRRCFPFLNVLDDIIVSRELTAVAAVRKAVGFRPLARYPFRRCAPVCFGTVEVYKRTCCCRPPILIDPDDLPIEVNPDFPFPPEEIGPVGPIGPRPGPDPAPIALQRMLITEGAIDEVKLARLAASALPKNLDVEGRRAFALRHPHCWCRCGTAKLVATGFVQESGLFSICWREPLTLLSPRCHEEFAYVVKQPIGGVLVTIYNGLAAGQWFHAGEEPTLTSYHPRAIGCRESDVPGEGAFVVLEDIGSTPSHRLATPAQTAAVAVGAPAYNSGLLDPTPIAAVAVGQLLNRNLGGNVALQYHFTEPMRAVGAVFFRIQVARADAAGNPTGGWTPLAPMTWATWRLGTATPGSIALGPHSAGSESGLSKIPYDSGDPLGPNEEWQDGQFHGVIPTGEFADDRHLVMIELFDAAGTRLKPLAAPAGEAGAAANFSFRRWQQPTGPAATVDVPFAALTHMFWWDNRPAVADIEDIRLNGTPSSDQCQFLESGPSATVSIGYRAYHPQPGQPSFLHNHSLTITRGLNGPSWEVANAPGDEVGEGGPPHASLTLTLDEMLGDEPVGHQKCAFAVRLHANVKTTNGAGTLDSLDRGETAAFAAEIV